MGAAAARAEAATFLLFDGSPHDEGSPHKRFWPAFGVAFYIGSDEWIAQGNLGRFHDRRTAEGDLELIEAQYAIRQGLYENVGRRPFGDDLRPVRVIGYDAATDISLLEASGDGVPPLRLAAAVPPLCTPLRVAGYWVSFSDWPEHVESFLARAAERAVALRFPDPAACDPAVPPPLIDRSVLVGVLPRDEYFAPGTVGAALGEMVTEARGVPALGLRPIPRLRLHPSDDMDTRVYADSWWSGGPLVTAAGDVVGVLLDQKRDLAVAAPAVIEALERIRADADN